ncbi:MAG: hypothetical protein R3257_02015 [bacterium]|nr:hypothetical protein [bacterium]
MLSLSLISFPLVMGACANTAENDPCFGFECSEDETCLVVDGEPTCSPIGGAGDGDQGAGQGELCDTNEDCMTPLICTEGVDAIPRCT